MDHEGAALGVASESVRKRANERLSEPPTQNRRGSRDNNKKGAQGRGSRANRGGKQMKDGVQGTIEAPPGVQISPEAQGIINKLASELKYAQSLPGKEPGFWSRATTGLGEAMVQVAAETTVVLIVVGLGYLVKMGVETLFFKDETAGL
jgi:hypothetical protein